MLSDYWVAFNNVGLEFIARNNPNKLKIELINFIIQEMNIKNVVPIKKKKDLIDAMKRKYNLNPNMKTAYGVFYSLEDDYFIHRVDSPIPGFMFNPFIAYRGGKKGGEANALKWIKLFSGVPVNEDDISEGIELPDKSIMSPFEPRMFRDFEGAAYELSNNKIK